MLNKNLLIFSFFVFLNSKLIVEIPKKDFTVKELVQKFDGKDNLPSAINNINSKVQIPQRDYNVNDLIKKFNNKNNSEINANNLNQNNNQPIIYNDINHIAKNKHIIDLNEINNNKLNTSIQPINSNMNNQILKNNIITSADNIEFINDIIVNINGKLYKMDIVSKIDKNKNTNKLSPKKVPKKSQRNNIQQRRRSRSIRRS